SGARRERKATRHGRRRRRRSSGFIRLTRVCAARQPACQLRRAAVLSRPEQENGAEETMKMRSFQVCQCGAPLQMNEAEATKPQGTQVLLKMLAAGVCHSDLHIWDGYYEIGGGKKLM